MADIISMKNAKLKLIPCAIALIMGGMYSTTAAAHGFVKSPMSRSFYFYSKGNPSVQWPANEIEAPKLPAGGNMEGDNAFENKFDFPPDGKLASGNNANRSPMDNESYAWHLNPMKSGPQQFEWLLSAPHRTTYFTYYITRQDWKSMPGAGQKLTKAMFEDKPFCHDIWASGKPLPPRTLVHTCNVPQRTGEQKIYAVWRVRDTPMAFYQMIDVDFSKDGGGEGEVEKPNASIGAATTSLSTSNLMLDGRSSSGKDLKYSWAVQSNGDKVILEGSNSSQAYIRLKSEPANHFDVVVKLTVTDSKGVSHSQTITLKAQAQEETSSPVAVAGKNFTVTSKGTSAGYDLDGRASQNATSYKWTIVKQEGGTFWLQEKNGAPWTHTVNQATARALVPANTTGKVTYRLTVTGKTGKTSVSDITVTVNKEAQQPDTGDYQTWSKGKTYTAGNTVSWKGVNYIARNWTLSEPGQGADWKLHNNKGPVAWQPSMTYELNNLVSYQGKTWKASQWISANNVPGQSSLWKQQ
jgi:predicted carbohydrate-binding protein with CBM5 and CBM33 domain